MGILTGNLHKVVFGGKLTVNEQWACSLHMATQGVETSEDGGNVLAFDPVVKDWFERAASHLNKAATLEYVKCNQIDRVTGLYVNQSETFVGFYNPILVPSPLGSNDPPQNSIALTWHTDLNRGRASKGRIYPPSSTGYGSGTWMGPDGLLAGSQAQECADSAQEFLAEMNNATVNLTAVVWSRIAQQARAIERVSCGRAVDTQQRRRKSLDESRVFAIAAV